MKFNAIVSTLVAMSLGVGGPVLAQPNNPPPGQRAYQRPGAPGAHHPGRPDLRQPGARVHPYSGPRAVAPPGYHYPPPGAVPYRPPGARVYPGPAYRPAPGVRGVGPDFRYYRGDRLPLEYRRWNYVVDDWRSHRLYPPPRGYHWVQVGADYVLVAIATGIIIELLLHN